MIDLSFLTEEEQDAILKVLQRDAALKRAEEERVRHLPEKIKDDQQLKNMSGQWFYEAKAKRHRDKIHGADIIRASMRKKRLPVAAEQSKDTAMRAKESWVNNVNKDAFLPPELAVVEQPEDDTAPAGPSSNVVDPASSMIDMSPENTRNPAVSLPKQRKNPFNNSKLPEDHSPQQTKNEQSKTGKSGLFQISKEGESSESKEKTYIPDISSQKFEKPKQPESLAPENGSQIKAPIPKARKLIYKSNDLKADNNQSFPIQRRDSLNARGAPRGILKRNSSSSSTDSETLRLNYNFDPKNKTVSPGLTIHERISEKEHSLEDDSPTNSPEPLKHVRFSAVKDKLPQSPWPGLSQEVGEFTVLESDRLQNGTEDAGGIDKFQDHQTLSHKKPLSLYQSVSSSSVSKMETHQPMSSGTVPGDGLPCHSDSLPTRPQPVENPLIINEYQDKSPYVTRGESESSKSPADELTPCVKPESSQISDHSFRDHQQGKPLLMALNAQTSWHSGPCATEIRKTTDDSISKVLDWFNRSSHTEDSMSSLQHLQGLDLRQQTLSEPQTATALMIDNNCLKEDVSKVLPSSKIKLKPVRSDLTFQEEGDVRLSETCPDSDVLLRYNSANLAQQRTLKEDPETLQPSESYRIPSQMRGSMDCSRGSESTGEGCGTVTPNGSYLLSSLKRSEAEPQVPWNSKHTDSLGKEEPKFHVPQKSKGSTHMNVDASVIVLEHNSKGDVEGKIKTRNTSILKPSLRPEYSELPLGTANSGSSCKKPEGQEEAGEGPKNQVVREKYKRVSDRISFWEGEKTGANIKAKELKSSCSQEPSSAKAYNPVKSQVMLMGSLSPGQSDYGQVTAKRVILDENNQTSHLFSFYSSNEPKTTRPPISGPFKNHSSADQSDKVSPLQTTGHEIHPSLEKDRFAIDKSNANFKVLSLRERMDEPSTEQVYNHSQFENLRKFWGLGANLNNKDKGENNTATNKQKSVPFNSQKSKEFDSIESRENTHEVEERRHLRQGNITAAKETEKLNSKCTLQAPPDETIFPQKPSRKSTDHLVENEPSKENVEKNMGCFVAPVIKEKNDHSDKEIQESIVKTGILPKVSKDTFNDGLQKLLAEDTLPAIQTSGKKVHEQQVLQVGVSENRTWSPKKSVTEDEEDVTEPKNIPNEHLDEVAALPKFQQNTSVDELLKEATRTSSTPFQSPLESVTARPNYPSKDGRLFEKWIKQKHSPSGDQREITAPFPQGAETTEDTALAQKAECFNTEGMPQAVAERSPPLAQPSHSFVGVSNSPEDMTLSQETHLGSQDGTLPSQREISEAIEKVVLPSKPAMTDINAVLWRLLREAEEMKAKLPETVQTGPQRVSPPTDAVVSNNKDFHSFYTVPDTAREGQSYVSAGMSPSENLIRSPVSTITQSGQELLQDVAETVRETVIPPKLECLEFRAGLEKLREETLETSLSKDEDTETICPSAVTGGCEVSQQLASELHPKEIQETVEKTEATSVTESTFDAGFEKLLKEMSEGPCQLQPSAKEDTRKQQTPQAEQDRVLGEIPHLYLDASGTSKMKVKCNVLESQVNQCDKLVGGDEAVTGPSINVHGCTSGLGTSESSQLYEHYGTGIIETVQSVEDRGRETAVAGGTWVPQEPGFEEAPKEVSVSRNKQSTAFLETTGKPTKMSGVESELATASKRQEKEQRLEASSESEFSDGNSSSNGESWRNTSSSEEEHSPVLKTLERSAARKMPSKSLEDISSDSSNQAKVDNLPEELVRSAEDVSTAPSLPDNQFSHPDKLKRMSKSVPAFLQDESDDRETDTASESSYQLRRYKKSPSSLTNLSSSSGMTSLSSVSGSVMSVYSGDFGNLEVKGSVQFAIDYMESLKELHVFVAQCKDLAAADVKKQRSDPYVKTYLLPDKGKMGKKKTFVVKKTLNPVYNEILRYKIERQFLKTQKLNLSVWHRDTFKRNSFLGEVELDLETWDWDSKQSKQLKWYPLKRKTAPVALETENRGEMKLALQYVPEPSPGKKLPTTGEVHIWVKECFDLPLLRGSHLNSFVKCTILPDTSRKSRQKTRAVGKTTNPIFNHTMVYDGFRPEDLMEACVELTVWDHYKLTNQFLGGLRIGFGTGKSYGTEVDWMDSTSEEVALWEKMVNSPNTWIEATLPLRMLLIAKISK
ncbi:synaptotagmin-like protein 2 isoform X2 [Cricetulus griseus]|uniref:Synaptotagmin-like protein 2 n=1 Tax=Cricetulus griseus TaxID=10029 RepID=A0A9J7JWI5_CRIGR|nr:synaptotagmin-like protein 2 isoform X2 [Cricetulus griseus]XP_035298292.1 synaptotagmin-like protein 2 isoform X2 [Cricetulus griseus]